MPGALVQGQTNICCGKVSFLTKTTQGRKDVFYLTVWEAIVYCGKEVMEAGGWGIWLHWFHMDELLYPARFLFMWSMTYTRGWYHPPLGVSSHLSLMEINPRGCAQRAAWPVTLTVDISHHTAILYSLFSTPAFWLPCPYDNWYLFCLHFSSKLAILLNFRLCQTGPLPPEFLNQLVSWQLSSRFFSPIKALAMLPSASLIEAFHCRRSLFPKEWDAAALSSKVFKKDYHHLQKKSQRPTTPFKASIRHPHIFHFKELCLDAGDVVQ